MKRCPVSCNFSIQGFFNQCPSLDLSLSFLNLGHDPVNILQFLGPFPENCGIFLDFFRGFSLNFFGDLINVISAIFLMKSNECIEISFWPVGETWSQIKKYILILENILKLFFIFTEKKWIYLESKDPLFLPVHLHLNHRLRQFCVVLLFEAGKNENRGWVKKKNTNVFKSGGNIFGQSASKHLNKLLLLTPQKCPAKNVCPDCPAKKQKYEFFPSSLHYAFSKKVYVI